MHRGGPSARNGDATLSTTVYGAANTNLRARFEVTQGGAVVWQGYSPLVPGGSKASVSVPGLSTGSYSVRAWSNNGGQSSTSPSSSVVVRNMGQLQTRIDNALAATSSESAAPAADLMMPEANDPVVRLKAGTESLTADDDPDDANDEITITTPTSGSVATMTDGISRSHDGDSDASTVVLQPLEDSARALIMLHSSSAPKRYDFTLGGEVASLEIDQPDVETGDPGGGVTAYNSQGDIIGLVDEPWAVDANGTSVPTHYEINGTTLTQVISPTADTPYPVVADPDLIFFAKCAAAIVEFGAKNGALMVKFWKVFKSVKKLVKLFKDIRKMSKANKISYIKNKLGSIAGSFLGIPSLVTGCTP